jgi:dUTP pyrophosphatase
MIVKVKKLNEKAVIPFKTYDNDFCYDVVATSCEEVAPNIYKYGLGLAFQIVRDDWEKVVGCKYCNDGFTTIKLDTNYENLSIDFRPRSSVWKTGMVLSNCVGTIDELYRGEVCAVFYHVMTDLPKYEVGDRIGQIKIGTTFPIEFVEVDVLDDTERGDGGYGSTGK